MHSSSFDTTDVNNKDGGEVLVGIATLVTEGRIPAKLNSKTKKFYEGPHCTTLTNKVNEHKCDLADALCMKFNNNRDTVLQLWRKNIPICIEVLLSCVCNDDGNNGTGNNLTTDTLDSGFLLEQWHFDVNFRRNTEPLFFNLHQLISAIRSQLYFSQITAWLTTNDETVTFNINKYKLSYRLTIPGETYETTKFTISAIKHDFPITDIGNGLTLKVSFLSLPRMCTIPNISCRKCTPKQQPVQQQEQQEPPSTPPENSFLKLQEKMDLKSGDLVDDRMHTSCTMKGKHRCEDYEEFDSNNVKMEHHLANFKRLCQSSKKINGPEPSTSHSRPKLKVNIDAAYAEINQLKPGKMEKRNISPNDEQIVKSVKLDLTDDKNIWAKTFNCNTNKNDLNKGQLLLDAIERSGQKSTNCNNGVHDEFDGISDKICVQSDRSYCCANKKKDDSDMAKCDNMSDSDIFSIKQKNNFNIYVDNNYCDSPMPALKRLQQKQQSAKRLQDVSNINLLKGVHRVGARQKLTFDDDDADDKDNSETTNSCDKKDISKNCNENNNIPTPMEQAKFRKNLDNAASMVFHSRTGLPLTSSPAPVRRGKTCFDFDSSINSVSAIKSALFSNSFSTDDESESEGSIVSPCSPETYALPKGDFTPVKYRRKGHAANLLGSFEESVLNGRLEPVSTVHGFSAELGASGSFVPKHLVVPVTVFFYTLGDNDKVSSPYLSHINLGKKGYNVPKSGTVQVTLFNPLGTVVKMFVIMYDLSDMPPNSQTFIRQRTLYMPTNCKDENLEWGPKWLRYLIHLRFMSSKSGKIYLHSDIRMIIFRKSDMDTATAHGIDMCYELRSFTHMPTNPKFSPRK